jgi:hypothetical protein
VGVYKIKYATVQDDTLKTLHGSHRILGKGQSIGFERDADGAVIAVAGDERFRRDAAGGRAVLRVVFEAEDTPRFQQHLGDFVDVAVPVLVVGAVVVAALRRSDDCYDDAATVTPSHSTPPRH